MYPILALVNGLSIEKGIFYALSLSLNKFLTQGTTPPPSQTVYLVNRPLLNIMAATV